MEIPDVIIVAGPVIIEDGKVLLVRENKATGLTPWFFPGGMVENLDETLEGTCRREGKEETGADIEIIRPLRTMLKRRTDYPEKSVVLVHYLAKRTGDIMPSDSMVAAYEWHDIKNLPDDCAPNVKQIIQEILQS